MTHHGNVTKINGAEVEPYPIAVTKSRFKEAKRMTRKEILTEAEKCVCTDREQQYGSPENNFRLIATLWEPYLKSKCVSPDIDICINPDDVAIMMALLKIARIATGEPKADNYIDLAGYASCAGEIAMEAVID